MIDSLSNGQVFVTWKTPSVLGVFKGISADRHHHEFTGDEELDTRPLDVMLLSKNNIQEHAWTSPKQSHILVRPAKANKTESVKDENVEPVIHTPRESRRRGSRDKESRLVLLQTETRELRRTKEAQLLGSSTFGRGSIRR